MLTDLREKSQSFLIYILFGILIIVFIFFFGPQAEGCQPGAPQARNLNAWAANVDGTEVSVREVEISVRRQALFEQDFDDDRAAISRLRREKLEQVIDQTLVSNQARRMGIAVDSKALSRYIVSKENPDFPLFRDRAGKFDRGSYRDQLQQVLGATPEAYRQVKERELVIRRYLDFLASQITISDSEVKADFDGNNRTWNLEYMVFNPRDYKEKIASVTPAEGAAHAAKAPNEVKAYYAANKATYQRDKEVKIRRILIRRPKHAADLPKAKEKAQAALTKAKADGADFGALAKELSEGAYKNYDGVMGWQSTKNTQDYKVYAALNKGEVSTLQEDEIGFWFVKADDVREAIDRKLEDVTSEIGALLLTEKRALDAAKKDAESVLSRASSAKSLEVLTQADAAPAGSEVKDESDVEGSGNPEAAPSAPTPAPKAVAQGPKVNTTGPISAARASDLIPGIGRSGELAKLLPNLTADKPLVDKVLKIGKRLFVARLKERVEPDAKKYESERDEIKARLKRARQLHLFGSWRAILYGPSQQRKTFQQFGSSALMALLENRKGVKINEAEFVIITPEQAKTPPAR